MWVLLIFWWGDFAGQLTKVDGFHSKKACLEFVDKIKDEASVAGSRRFFCGEIK
jgi:hypothetical protein